MSHKKKTIRADKDENWIFKVNIRTYDTKAHVAIPMNLASRFVTMEVYDITNALIASASTNAGSSALAHAVSGTAILTFPLSSTSGISDGLYNYNIFITDLPVRASATYVKKILHGPFELK